MTDKKPSPIQTARAWARRYPDASGLIIVTYLAPKGRGGRRGLARRHDRYLVQDGRAAKLTTRVIKRHPADLDLADIHMRMFNGWCYRCGILYLEPVLRAWYLPNPRVGQPVKNRFMSGTVYGYLGQAALCSSCAEEIDVVNYDDEHVQRQLMTPGVYTDMWMGGGTSNCPAPLIELSLEVHR